MIRTIAILLLLSSPALGEEQSIYKTPRIPTEEEKVNALKLGYILNGFSMSRAFSEGSIDITQYQRPLVLPSTIPPALLPDERGPDEVWPPAPAQVKPTRKPSR